MTTNKRLMSRGIKEIEARIWMKHIIGGNNLRPLSANDVGKKAIVSRVFSWKKPWEYLAPYCGLAAPGQGFFFIESDKSAQGDKRY